MRDEQILWKWRVHKAKSKISHNSALHGTYRKPETKAKLTAKGIDTMAARKDSRIKTKHREAIRTTMIRKRLEDHILGRVEMQPSQVTAALGLLKKTLPDLQSTEIDATLDSQPQSVAEMSNADLLALIAEGSKSTSSEKDKAH